MTLKDDLIGCIVTDVEIEEDDGRLYGVTITSQDGKIYTVGSTYDSNPALDVERLF